MASESGELPVDGRGGDPQVPGDLSVCHAAVGFSQELGQDIRALEPVSGREGLGAERPVAVKAEEPLDTAWGGLSLEGANAFEAPTCVQLPVELAFVIGAVGWIE
jgi:hypothetical protein